MTDQHAVVALAGSGLEHLGAERQRCRSEQPVELGDGLRGTFDTASMPSRNRRWTPQVERSKIRHLQGHIRFTVGRFHRAGAVRDDEAERAAPPEEVVRDADRQCSVGLVGSRRQRRRDVEDAQVQRVAVSGSD